MEDIMAEKKPASKAPANKRRLKVSLEKISEVRFLKDGEEYFLVPHRPAGVYILHRVPK